jgi:cytochrome c oxidase subunit IV
MAEGVKRPEEPAPPPGEPVHLPGPSYLPVLTALGITLALVGVVISWVVTAIGLVIAVIAVVRWIRETREEISELPLEH